MPISTIVLGSVPLTVVWMLMTKRWTLESAIVGYVFAVVILIAVMSNIKRQGDAVRPLSWARLPRQAWNLIIYVAKLLLDIFTSGIDVALRILPAKLRISPSFQRVPVQDKHKSDLIAALSAHAITITPGSLVVDYENDAQGQMIMVVHVLDGDTWTEQNLSAEQAQRVKRLQAILGQE
jgi:multisubunit Na+/H+ antiporter MnhE subunit